MMNRFRIISMLFFFLCISSSCTHWNQKQVINKEVINLQLIAFNDFHGNLLPLVDEKKSSLGGIAHLAAYVEELKKQAPHTVVISAGDLVGASPLISSFYQDEPTITMWDKIGLEYSTVGNHEFDEGVDELLRLQSGGCYQNDCNKNQNFAGAKFSYLAANVMNITSKKLLFPPYAIKKIGSVDVGFIGAVTKNAPSLLTPSSVIGLEFLDEVQAINSQVIELKKQGVQTIIVMLHEGGEQSKRGIGQINLCENLSGRIIEIVSQLDEAVDVVVSGHTHDAYICNIKGKLVTSAWSTGKLLTKINLKISLQTNDVVEKKAENIIIRSDRTSNLITELVQQYQNKVISMEKKHISETPVLISNKRNESGESPLGKLVADAHQQQTALYTKTHVDFAWMNWHGIRSEILKGEITFGDLYKLMPFGQSVNVISLTGNQIMEVLESQFASCPNKGKAILQASKGLSYSWVENGKDCQKVPVKLVKINGKPISLSQRYLVAVNGYLSTGGDGFVTFTQGQFIKEGPSDLMALEKYLIANPDFYVTSPGRIHLLNR